MTLAARILYICHDGQLYGSQQSLALLLEHLNRFSSHPYQVSVSMARPGPLRDKIHQLNDAHISTVMTHRRLQWFKHDRRSAVQAFGDILTLICLLPVRVGYLVYTIRRQKINVVHTNSVVSLEGALAAWACGVPHIWHIRELFMWDNPKLFPVLGRNLTRTLIDRLSARVICISQAVREQFGPCAERSPEKYPVVHNAVTSEPLNGTSPGDILPDKPDFRFGYIGRLSEGKRFHELLEALSRLDSSINWDLIVAGTFVDAEYDRKIHDLIATYGLANKVHLLGYRDDLAPLYASMDLLVVPSLNEPFGRVVIEAMQHGVTCVAANSGGIPEIIKDGETGRLYPPGDVATLSSLLARAIQTPDEMRRISENAGRMVRERFTIETQVRKLDACYQALLNP